MNRISIVTPCFNESANLAVFYKRLCDALSSQKDNASSWEWIIIDDHSTDDSFQKINELNSRDPRVRGMRLSKNTGSHKAILCGLEHADGDCAVVMALDLQDPPERIPELIKNWKQGSQIVWGVRERREGVGICSKLSSRLYYLVMRRIVGIKEMPPSGADFFLMDRIVLEQLKQFREHSISLFALVTWMGFRQKSIFYTKEARLHGTSGWTFRKKIRLLTDSVISFSPFPLRVMSYFGFTTAFLGLVYATIILGHFVSGERPHGWASLMVVVLVMGGGQLFMMGILGEYLWRVLEESRARPRYLKEAEVGGRPFGVPLVKSKPMKLGEIRQCAI